MEQRKKCRTRYGEDGHRLGEAVNRSAPFLVQQQQDCRNKSTRVADTDPPYEIHNREAPRDRDVNAPNSDAANEQPSDRKVEQHEQHEGDAETAEPAEPKWPLEHGATDIRRDRFAAEAGLNEGSVCIHADSSSGLKLRTRAR